MEPQQHFNHLSDVKHELDNYHSAPHGILASLLAQGLKELSYPEKKESGLSNGSQHSSLKY